MHPELEKLVQMALVDGQVTDKEREIILRKAEKLGLDVDEVEMYLEGKIGFSIDQQNLSKDIILISDEVKIGNQIWMTRNLNVDSFRNGDPISHAKTDEEWKKAGNSGKPAWCFYNNNQNNGERYGKLYNWHAVNDSRGLAPKDFIIPSNKDWIELSDFLGGLDLAGRKLKYPDFWVEGDCAKGTNESGFCGLAAGSRNFDGPFDSLGRCGHWWCSNESLYKEYRKYAAGVFYLDYNTNFVNINDDIGNNKSFGFSVRCIKFKLI
jgi:uncharacterized protein (TIGR02145 family)